MKAEINYFNSIEAATILGVNVSTIKRWTDEGHLECIKSAGGHRKFLIEHLAAFLNKHKKKTTKLNIFPAENSKDLQMTLYILRGNYEYLIDYVYHHALKCNLHLIQKVLNGLFLAQFPIHQIYDRLIVPVLVKIGNNWENNEISIAEEHFASQTIKDSICRLQGILNLPKKSVGNVICALPSKELHDISLKMVQHILEIKGYKVFFSGQITPLKILPEICEKLKVSRIYISSTNVVNVSEISDELISLYDFCLENQIDIFVGGIGFDKLPSNHKAVVRRMFNFEDVYNF